MESSDRDAAGLLQPGHKLAGAPRGNKNAAKSKRWERALSKALAEYEDPTKQLKAGDALDRIAIKVVTLALEGDRDSIEEIGNRLDGRPKQALVGGDEDDAPILIASRIELIDLGSGTTPAET